MTGNEKSSAENNAVNLALPMPFTAELLFLPRKNLTLRYGEYLQTRYQLSRWHLKELNSCLRNWLSLGGLDARKHCKGLSNIPNTIWVGVLKPLSAIPL